MGYLGAQERPTDPTTGLIQMGARSYDPSLGSFASEDPVPGHLGLGDSADRYLYVWDNPLSRYDLDGRDVCGTAGEVPVIGGVLETGCHVATYHSPIEQTPVEDGEELGKRAQDFVKYASTHTFGLCLNGAGGAGVGINAQLCVAGNLHSIGVTASGGGGAYLPFGAEAGAGPLYSNAHSPCELGGPFASGGAGAGEGIRGGVNGATGTTSGNRTVNVYHPWLGVGAGPPVSGNAGVSDTFAPCASW
jgi:RHS repeat-associated protein